MKCALLPEVELLKDLKANLFLLVRSHGFLSGKFCVNMYLALLITSSLRRCTGQVDRAKTWVSLLILLFLWVVLNSATDELHETIDESYCI